MMTMQPHVKLILICTVISVLTVLSVVVISCLILPIAKFHAYIVRNIISHHNNGRVITNDNNII